MSPFIASSFPQGASFECVFPHSVIALKGHGFSRPVLFLTAAAEETDHKLV